jgi:hypothetical protein
MDIFGSEMRMSGEKRTCGSLNIIRKGKRKKPTKVRECACAVGRCT